MARLSKVDVCFDAEEADRLNLSLLLVNKILDELEPLTKYIIENSGLDPKH